MKIIDMHNHILHNVDDGANSLEQAINMIKMAYADNVKKIIVTPHYHIGRMIANKEECKLRIEELKNAINKLEIDMDIFLGHEIYYHAEAMEKVINNEIFTLANSSYVLVEFNPGVDIQSIHKAINDTIIEGYIPIIAHFERYECLDDNIKKCNELIEMGAYLQANVRSVIGENGSKIKRFIKKMMKKRLISFVASDAHEDRIRKPKYKECYEYVRKKISEEYALKIFYDNQMKVINDQIIDI